MQGSNYSRFSRSFSTYVKKRTRQWQTSTRIFVLIALVFSLGYGQLFLVNNSQAEVALTGDLTICKYQDLTGDGPTSDDQPYLLGWNMTVINNSIGFNQQVTTDGQTGCVVLSGLEFGVYQVTEETKTNWTPSDWQVVSNQQYGQITPTELAVDIFDTDGAVVTFYNYQVPTGSISGMKFNDLDRDGLGPNEGDTDDPGIPGWTISLYSQQDDAWVLVTSVQTDNEGLYRFDNVPANVNYKVEEETRNGWQATMPNGQTYYTISPLQPGSNHRKMDFGNYQICSGSGIIDEVLPGSLSTWSVTNSGGNPIFSYGEITSPYDGSTAIQTSVVGNTYSLCPSQYIEKIYNISGNTDYTDLEAYLAFSSTMDEYNFPYLVVYVLDENETSLGYQVYYGNGVISGIYQDYAAASPEYYTELPSASGYMTLDLAKIGININFSKIKVMLANYACVGENSIVFDHLQVVGQCDAPEPTGTIRACKYEESQCLIESQMPDWAVFKNGRYWAWASPCSGSCSTVEPIKIPGWRFATPEEWEQRPAVSDFGTYDNYKCAAPYFDYTYGHCDYWDAENGYLTSEPNNDSWETWLIYDCVPADNQQVRDDNFLTAGLAKIWDNIKIKAAQALSLLPGIPLSNWTINLNGNEMSQLKVTDQSGCVEFTDLPYGNYTVSEVIPEDWQQVQPGGAGIHQVTLDSCFEEVYFLNRYIDPVYGCTDPTALNYDAEANKNDGSCEYPVRGGGGGPVTITDSTPTSDTPPQEPTPEPEIPQQEPTPIPEPEVQVLGFETEAPAEVPEVQVLGYEELPETGGPMSSSYYLYGLLLILAGGYLARKYNV